MNPKVAFLSPEECAELAEQMTSKYTNLIGQRYFEITTRADGHGVYATVVLRNRRASFYYPVDGRIAHMDHDMDERKAVLFLLDCIDDYFAEYLRERGEVYLPIDWHEYGTTAVPVQLKGQILNLELERMADEILAGSKPADVELN